MQMIPSRLWNKKSTLVALRVTATVATGVLLWLYPPSTGLTAPLVILWFLYLLTTIGYALLPAFWYGGRRFDVIAVGIELVLLGSLIAVYGGITNWIFYPLFLLVVLLAVLARQLSWALLLGAAVTFALLIVYMEEPTGNISVLILQMTILLTTAGMVGYLTEELDQTEAASNLLDNAIEITTLLAGTMNAGEVYENLTRIMARLFHAGRVSVILAKLGDENANVVASVDRGVTIQDLTVELDRYPEVIEAMETREPVTIDRASRYPGLARVRMLLPARARDAAILVTPILTSGEPRGAIVVRLEDARQDFTSAETRFCRLMADVAGRALQRVDAFAAVAEEAERDGLTGLYNMRTFHRMLADEASRADRGTNHCTLVMIDVDYLKRVNDTHGHLAGDQVLRAIGGALLEEVRNIDIVARYGGDEFILLLPDTGTDRGLVVAERVRQRVAAIQHEDLALPTTVSVGLATYAEDANTPSDLIHKADQALYASKYRGRDQVLSYAEIRDQPDAARAPIATPQIDERDPTMVRTIREALTDMDPQQRFLPQLDVIATLAEVMRARDATALDQLRDMSTIAELFLATLPIPESERWQIHVACLLRDIGKLAIPESVLQKSDFLTREEFDSVRQHPAIGAQIIEPLHDLSEVVPIVLHHHERWDGKGYPDGMRLAEIPYGARVVGILDAFYAMIRLRPYATRSRGLRYACEEIRRNAGSQFDPELAQRFLFAVDANRDILATLVTGVETGEPVSPLIDEEQEAGGVVASSAVVEEPGGAEQVEDAAAIDEVEAPPAND